MEWTRIHPLFAIPLASPLIVRALVPVQEQLTAKSLALAVADQRVAGMKKALELVSLALPPPPPPLHAHSSPSVNQTSADWSDWASSPCHGVACSNPIPCPTSNRTAVPAVANADNHSAYPSTTPPLLDGDKPNDDNHDNGIGMLLCTGRRRIEQQQQQQQQEEEEEEVTTLTRQKAQLGEDILSLGRAQHHLNEDHAALAERHAVHRYATYSRSTYHIIQLLTHLINTSHHSIVDTSYQHALLMHLTINRMNIQY